MDMYSLHCSKYDTWVPLGVGYCAVTLKNAHIHILEYTQNWMCVFHLIIHLLSSRRSSVFLVGLGRLITSDLREIDRCHVCLRVEPWFKVRCQTRLESTLYIYLSASPALPKWSEYSESWVTYCCLSLLLTYNSNECDLDVFHSSPIYLLFSYFKGGCRCWKCAPLSNSAASNIQSPLRRRESRRATGRRY